jgi:hypothetical protein
LSQHVYNGGMNGIQHNLRGRGRWLAAVMVFMCTPIAASCELPQGIAVPAYFVPGPIWTTMTASHAVRFVVMNPNSGPGATRDAAYARVVATAQSEGIRVIGYVHTSYGKRTLPEVTREIDSYFAWYHIDGIFLDEAANDPAFIPYYKTVYGYIRGKSRRRTLTVINPGTQTDQAYMAVADIVVNFEGDYKTYTSAYSAPVWVAAYPASRFWHIVYQAPSTPDEKLLRQVIQLSRERNAGYIYITDDWYGSLPSPSFWHAETAPLADARP